MAEKKIDCNGVWVPRGQWQILTSRKSISLTKSIVAIDEILDSYFDRYAKPFEQISAIEI